MQRLKNVFWLTVAWLLVFAIYAGGLAVILIVLNKLIDIVKGLLGV